MSGPAMGSTCAWEHSTGTEQAGVLEGRGEVCRQLVDKSAMVEYSNSTSFCSVANCVIISNILFLINNSGHIWLTFFRGIMKVLFWSWADSEISNGLKWDYKALWLTVEDIFFGDQDFIHFWSQPGRSDLFHPRSWRNPNSVLTPSWILLWDKPHRAGSSSLQLHPPWLGQRVVKRQWNSAGKFRGLEFYSLVPGHQAITTPGIFMLLNFTKEFNVH